MTAPTTPMTISSPRKGEWRRGPRALRPSPTLRRTPATGDAASPAVPTTTSDGEAVGSMSATWYDTVATLSWIAGEALSKGKASMLGAASGEVEWSGIRFLGIELPPPVALEVDRVHKHQARQLVEQVDEDLYWKQP